LFNQLQCLLVISFPEFLQVMADVKTASAQHLLLHYPTAQEIVKDSDNTGERSISFMEYIEVFR